MIYDDLLTLCDRDDLDIWTDDDWDDMTSDDDLYAYL